MIVFNNLEKWMESEGVSREEFAERLGITRNYLDAVLRRDIEMSLKFLDKLCEVTGFTVGQAITWFPDSTYDMAKAYRENDVSFEKMYAIMKERGYTEYALSKALGFGINFMYELRRRGKARISSIKKIAEFLQVKPTDLFEIIEKPEKSEN